MPLGRRCPRTPTPLRPGPATGRRRTTLSQGPADRRERSLSRARLESVPRPSETRALTPVDVHRQDHSQRSRSLRIDGCRFAKRAPCRHRAQSTRGAGNPVPPTADVGQPAGSPRVAGAPSLESPRGQGPGLAEAKPVVPVVPGTDVEHAWGGGCERSPQALGAVRRLNVVGVRQVAERHHPAKKIIRPGNDVLRRLPPDNPGGDAPQFRGHGLSLPHAVHAQGRGPAPAVSEVTPRSGERYPCRVVFLLTRTGGFFAIEQEYFAAGPTNRSHRTSGTSCRWNDVNGNAACSPQR